MIWTKTGEQVTTSSVNFPVSVGALQSNYSGGLYNAFITKLNPSGSGAYSTYLGGGTEDHGAAIAVDSVGEALVTGYTNSNNFPTQSPLRGSLGGGTCGSVPCFDAFVSKLNTVGTGLVYSTYFGGSGGDYGYAIATDAAGNAYVTGLTTSTNLPVTWGAYQTTGTGVSYDAYVMKLNPAGSALVYSTYLGGMSSESAYGIAVDVAGNAYVTGYVYGKGFPVASPLQAANSSLNDVFVSKMNAAGSALIFSTYLGGTGHDVGQGIAVDSSGNAYVAGGTYSTNFPVTPGAFDTSYGGGAYNAFVAKFSGLRLPVARLAQPSITFPDQGLGSTSLPSNFTLTNNGDAPLALSSVTTTGDFSVTDFCNATLLPNTSCTLSATFTPTELGPRFGTVSVNDNAWGSPNTISLAGNGILAPLVSLAPSSLTFGTQLIGTTSNPQVVTVTNSGQSTLAVSDISSLGDFSQTNNCSSPIPPGLTCTVNIRFTPSGSGPRKSFVSIAHNAPGSPSIIVLTGVGTAANLVPSSINFPNQRLGTTGSPAIVTLTNAGTASMNIWQTAILGPDAADFLMNNNCGRALPSSGSCSFSVSFKPSKAGVETASLLVSDDGGGSPHSVALNGTGVIGGTGNLVQPTVVPSTSNRDTKAKPPPLPPLFRFSGFEFECGPGDERRGSPGECERPPIAREQPGVQSPYLPKLKEKGTHADTSSGHRATRNK